MKKAWATLLFTLCLLPLITLALPPSAKASPAQGPFNVKIDHTIQIRDGGLVVINDTVQLSTKAGETIKPVQNYTLGFPFAYQSNLDYAFAYETANPSSLLTLELNSGLGTTGFYGATAEFPQPIDISNGGSYKFTMVFVFSGEISAASQTVGGQSLTVYNATFPAYPSLTQNASIANVTIVFPTNFLIFDSYYQDEGISFTNQTIGSEQYFTFAKGNLTRYSYQAGWFAIYKSGGSLQVLEVSGVQRDIALSGLKQISVSDTYRVVRTDSPLDKIRVAVPSGAFDITAFDEYSQISSGNVTITQGSTLTSVNITFAGPYDTATRATFSVHYQLPWKDCVSTQSWSNYQVVLPPFKNPDWTIRQLTVNVALPEGAVLSSSFPIGLSSIQNSAYDTSLTYTAPNATRFNEASFNFGYQRLIFWESYDPTLWMGALVVAIGAIIGVWRIYKPPAAPVTTALVPIRTEDLRKFVDTYDDKRRLMRDLDLLEAQARKGKIPRRQYRVRKTTIESRIASLNRDLAGLRDKIRVAGPRYADLFRQVEVAEAELQGVEADINRTEIRYRRGEISAEAYHRLLEDSYRRRDRAKTTIDGVLLRLKEEMS